MTTHSIACVGTTCSKLDMGCSSAVALDEEEEPHPARRHRQVSHIVDYEDDWEDPTGLPLATTNTSTQQGPHQEGNQQQSRDAVSSDEEDLPAAVAGASAKRKTTVLSDDDDQETSSRGVSGQPRTAGHASPSLQDSPAAEGGGDPEGALQSTAARLAEEGLDPVEEEGAAGPRRPRHAKGGAQASQGSIKERMRQNQLKLQAVHILHGVQCGL